MTCYRCGSEEGREKRRCKECFAGISPNGWVRCRGENCESDDAEERYSLGITAGWWCAKHWNTAPYRKEGAEAYSFLDAGEYYDELEF